MHRTISKICCADCDYSFGFYEGTGMKYSPERVFSLEEDKPPLLVSLVEENKVREKAIQLLAEGAEPEKEYGHELYGCKTCHHLAGKFYFRLASSAGKHVPNYRCANCKKRLKRLTENEFATLAFKSSQMEVYSESAWKCPECNGAKLRYKVTAMWD